MRRVSGAGTRCSATRERHTGNPGLPRSWLEDPRENPEKRGFSGAVGPEDAEAFTSRN
jgi:hypothetical protein